MTRLIAAMALLALTACTEPGADTDVDGSVTIGPNGVRPNVSLRTGNVRVSPGGIRIGL